MNTDVGTTHAVVRELLKAVYGQVYVEFALKNPMYVPGEAIASDLFTSKLDQVRTSPNTQLQYLVMVPQFFYINTYAHRTTNRLILSN